MLQLGLHQAEPLAYGNTPGPYARTVLPADRDECAADAQDRAHT